MNTKDLKKNKKIKVNFYTSAHKKSEHPHNIAAFHQLFTKEFESGGQQTLSIQKNTSADSFRNLKIKIIEHSKTAKEYFGYIGVARDVILPSIYHPETNSESDIDLTDDDEVIEKCYFIYKYEDDLLIFNQNHLGPRVDDLSYILGKYNNPINDFDPIWRDNALKTLLTDNTIIKRTEISISLPRNFSLTSIHFDNEWPKQLIEMMDKNRMSRMSLTVSGRASSKKGAFGYLTNEIKQGLKELVSTYANSSLQSAPKLEKAYITPTDSKRSSLLDKEISSTQSVIVNRGYPEVDDIKRALLNAFYENETELKSYLMSNKI